jgi:hypothetical protein
VVRNAGAEREMILMRWGMRPPPRNGGPPVINIRNIDASGDSWFRPRNFQLGLMLATALAVLVLPTAAEAYTPEGRQACTGDAFRLCSAEIPNVDRVRACLHRNKTQLSPGCRGFISPRAHRPRPSGR